MRLRNTRTGTVVHVGDGVVLGREWVPASRVAASTGSASETPTVTPAKPKQADKREVWAAYIVATTDLTEAEATDLTKPELIELSG